MITECPTCKAPLHARTWAPAHLGKWFVEVYRCGAVYRWGAGAVVLQTCQDKP